MLFWFVSWPSVFHRVLCVATGLKFYIRACQALSHWKQWLLAPLESLHCQQSSRERWGPQGSIVFFIILSYVDFELVCAYVHVSEGFLGGQEAGGTESPGLEQAAKSHLTWSSIKAVSILSQPSLWDLHLFKILLLLLLIPNTNPNCPEENRYINYKIPWPQALPPAAYHWQGLLHFLGLCLIVT